MAHAKPRGSILGIKTYQIKIRDKTRLSLLQAITSLKINSPHVRWTNIELCKQAGLTSSVALKKPWNKDIWDMLIKHNSTVHEGMSTDNQKTVESHQRLDKRMTAKIDVLKAHLVRRDAELLALEKENQLLRQQLERQEKLRRLVVNRN